MSWLAEYWLSILSVAAIDLEVSHSYPIQVSIWDDKGYLENPEVEGGYLMLLHRSPKVTVWPGGMETIKCRCSSVPGKGQCTTCVCVTKGYGSCSELCRCRLAWCEEQITGSERHRNRSDEEDSVDEESDSDSDEDDLPGVGMGADLGLDEDVGVGFLPEHVSRVPIVGASRVAGAARTFGTIAKRNDGD
ncbi:unnamed protein product [Pylaiella littoralis]